MIKKNIIKVATILVIALTFTGVVDAWSQANVNTQSQYGLPGQQTTSYGTSQSIGGLSNSNIPAISEGFAISGYDYSLGYSMGIGDVIDTGAGSSIQSPGEVSSIGGSYASGDYASTGGYGTADSSNNYNSASTDEFANAIGNAFGYSWSFSW